MLALWREAGSVPGVSDDPASLERLLETSADALLVAQVEGRVAGTVIAGWDGWRGSLYRLAVPPRVHQALGAGADHQPRRKRVGRLFGWERA